MEGDKLLIRNASQVITCSGFAAKRGAEMSNLHIIDDGAVVISGGIITHVRPVRFYVQSMRMIIWKSMQRDERYFPAL